MSIISGPGIHYIVGKKLPREFSKIKHGKTAEILQGLQNHPKATALGTQGPDFLFFMLRDMPIGFLADLVNLMIEVGDTIADFKKKVIGCIPDEVIAVKERVEDGSATINELEDAVTDFRNLVNGLVGIIQAQITNHVSQSIDIFNLLKHPIQNNEDFPWWWFDILHYIRTGKFAEALLKSSFESFGPDSSQHAYAIGYLSHIGSDVVGHPYVNLLAGGPYRLHAQRHKVVESYQDVWAFKKYYNELGPNLSPTLPDEEFIYSGLHKRFHFEDGRLPEELAKLILDAMKRTYGSQLPFGRMITEDDIDQAYRFWYRWFKNLTAEGTPPRPQPYSLTGELAEVWQDFVDNLGDIADLLPDAYNAGGGGLWGILLALLAALLLPALLALAIADYILANIATIGLAPFRFLMTVAYEYLYDAYCKYRQLISLTGLSYPFSRHLNEWYAVHFTDTGVADYFGNYADLETYPKLAWQHPDPEFPSHLVFPRSALEQFRSQPAPKSYLGKRPSHYIDGHIRYDEAVINWILGMNLDGINGMTWNTPYINPVPPLDINGEYAYLHKIMKDDILGNAVRLTGGLYNRFLHSLENPGEIIPIPNFNLDADRGIGYWSWNVDAVIPTNGTPYDIQFHDIP